MIVPEEEEGSIEGERRVAPDAVGKRDVGGAVQRLDRFRKQDRLAIRRRSIAPPVRQEAVRCIGPELLVEVPKDARFRHHQQPLAIAEQLLAQAGKHALNGRGSQVVEIDQHQLS